VLYNCFCFFVVQIEKSHAVKFFMLEVFWHWSCGVRCCVYLKLLGIILVVLFL